MLSLHFGVLRRNRVFIIGQTSHATQLPHLVPKGPPPAVCRIIAPYKWGAESVGTMTKVARWGVHNRLCAVGTSHDAVVLTILSHVWNTGHMQRAWPCACWACVDVATIQKE